VTDDYFRALGIALRAGRPFGPQDRPDGPPVVIVSEGLARRHWPGGNAVGGRLRFGADAPWMEVVGVVADVANDPRASSPSRRPTCPMRQAPWNGPIFLLRTAGEPAALAGAGAAGARRGGRARPAPPRDADAGADPGGARRASAPGDAHERLRGARAPARRGRRVRAVRRAGGRARARVRGARRPGREPAGHRRAGAAPGGAWLGAGLAVGAVGVAVVARVVRGLLVGVGPSDPVALGAALAILVACAAAALVGPVRRAARVDPIAALR
jgi:hypothetical protein